MPSDKKPAAPPKSMTERIRAAYLRVYGCAHDDRRAALTYDPFVEGYLACHRDKAAIINRACGVREGDRG